MSAPEELALGKPGLPRFPRSQIFEPTKNRDREAVKTKGRQRGDGLPSGCRIIATDLNDLPACAGCGRCCHQVVGLVEGVDVVPEEWVVEIRDQCRAAGVPFFFKQWGGVRKRETGRRLAGRTYSQFPDRDERTLAVQRFELVAGR